MMMMMMIRRAYLVLLLISSSSSIHEEYVVVTAAAASTSSRVLNVGALVSLDSTIGRVARVAMEAAVAHVNRDPTVLPSTTLHLSVQDTNYTGFVGMVQGVSLMEKRTVAIIGPQYSVTAHVISPLANELQVPLLSFSATDPTLSSLQYPFFVRATRSDAFQMAAIAEMVQYFGWRELIAVYVDDDHGRNGIAALEDKLAEQRCRISFRAPLNGGFTREDITDVLLKVALQESRIVVLLAYPEWGLQVLNTAQYLGMTATGYVWILTDWLSTLLDTDSPLPQEAMNSIRGVITLRIYSPDSPSKSKFVSDWSNLVSGGSNTSSLGLSTYGMYAYDTVWLLARAFDTFFDRGGEISFSPDPKLASEPAGGHFKADDVGVFDGGKLLLDSILNISMSGVTGQIKFNSDGNLIHPAYEIINVIGTGFRRIGYWSNHSGLTLLPPETLYSRPSNYSSSNQQLRSVIWPGQTTVKPRGWVFPNNGKHLTIGVPKQNIFPEFVSVRGNDMFTGFCIELFTSALNLLPYAVPYTFKASEDDHTELLQMMTAGIYDALVGDIAITTTRTKIADFTQPFIESGLVVVAPVRRLNSSAWAFLRPFSPSMWILIGVLFVVVGAVIWTLEHKVNDDFRGPPRRQIITILWFSFSTLFFAHRERTISGFGRLILIMWLFVVFILISSYTASLTSILTVEQLSSPVKGIESLVSSNGPIGLQRGSFAEDYLMEEYKIDKSRFVPLSSAEEYTKALRDGPSNGGVVAVVDERAYMELFLSTRCEFSIVGQEFSKLGWGFAFPRDSPLAVDMSTAILKLSEGGDLQRMHNKWLMRSACSYEGAKEEAERLQLKSFWGLFAVCGLACFLALLVHFVHMVKQFGELHTEDDDDLESSGPSKRLQRFLSFVGEKEEEVIRRSKRRRMGRTSSRSIYGDDSIMVASFKSSASEA